MSHSTATKKMADFCRNSCPICTRGREKGEGFLHTFVKLEEGICPACRSYKKVYGRPAHEKIEKSSS